LSKEALPSLEIEMLLFLLLKKFSRFLGAGAGDVELAENELDCDRWRIIFSLSVLLNPQDQIVVICNHQHTGDVIDVDG
jgi:hypothetical protein